MLIIEYAENDVALFVYFFTFCLVASKLHYDLTMFSLFFYTNTNNSFFFSSFAALCVCVCVCQNSNVLSIQWERVNLEMIIITSQAICYLYIWKRAR